MHRNVIAIALALSSMAPISTAQRDSRDRYLRKLLEEARKAQVSKDHARALAKLKEVYRLAPGVRGLAQSIANTCVRIAGAAYLERDHERALRFYKQASQFDKKSASIAYGMAEASRALGKKRDAKEYYEDALARNSKHQPSLLRLGTLLADERAYGRALPYLEKALGLNPKDAALARLVAKTRADQKTSGSYRTKDSAHFRLAFDGKHGDSSRYVVDIQRNLDRCRRDLVRLFGSAPKRPITVVLYAKTDFDKLPIKADWVQAYYDGKVRIPLDSWIRHKSVVLDTMRHELAHAFLHQLVPGASPWLHEGLAQMAEGKRVDLAKAAFRKRAMYPATRLRQSFLAAKDRDEAKRLYAQSLVLCSLLDRQLGRNGLQRMLRSLAAAKRKGAAGEDAVLRRVLGKDLDGWQRQLAREQRLVAPPR